VESEQFSLNFEELEPELFHDSKETPTPVATCNVQRKTLDFDSASRLGSLCAR
jgi:hypothetical protein